jgi:hypothetical protein
MNGRPGSADPRLSPGHVQAYPAPMNDKSRPAPSAPDEDLARTHLLVASHSPEARARLVTLLSAADDLRISGQAGCASEVLLELVWAKPDALLIDEALAFEGEPELLKRIRRQAPHLVVVVLLDGRGGQAAHAEALGADLAIGRGQALTELIEAFSLGPTPRPRGRAPGRA